MLKNHCIGSYRIVETVLIVKCKSKKQTSIDYSKQVEIVLNRNEIALSFTEQVSNEENEIVYLNYQWSKGDL